MQNTTTLGENQRKVCTRAAKLPLRELWRPPDTSFCAPCRHRCLQEAETAASALKPDGKQHRAKDTGERSCARCHPCCWPRLGPHTPQGHPHFPPVLALAAPVPSGCLREDCLIIIPNMSWLIQVTTQQEEMAANLRLKMTDLQNTNSDICCILIHI